MTPPGDPGPDDDRSDSRRRWRPRWTQVLGVAALLFLAVSAVLLLTDPGEEQAAAPTGVTTALPPTPTEVVADVATLDPGSDACLGFGRLLTRRTSGVNDGDTRALEAVAEEATGLAEPLDVAGGHLAEAARLARVSVEAGRAGERDRSTDSFLLARLSEAEAVAAARERGCPGEQVALPPASPTPRPAITEGDRLLDVLRDTYRSQADGVEPTDPAARAELYVVLGSTASGMDALVAETACTVGFLNNLYFRADGALRGYITFVSVLDVCIDVGAVDERIGRSEFRGG